MNTADGAGSLKYARGICEKMPFIQKSALSKKPRPNAMRPAIVLEKGLTHKRTIETIIDTNDIGITTRFAITETGEAMLKYDAIIGHVPIQAAIDTDTPFTA
jgi:hypothetical protein